MSPAKRVLCLHGYSQNGVRLRSNMGAIRKALKDIEFVYVDAPHIASQPRPDQVLPEGKPLGWWNMTTSVIWKDAQASIKCVLDFIKEQGPFDGILGFSQGAGMIPILLTVLDYKAIPPVDLESLGNTEQPLEKHFIEFLGELKPHVDALGDKAQLKFAIMGGGFVANNKVCLRLLRGPTKFDLPSLHIMGKTDAVITNERSMELSQLFSNPELIVHAGGHFLPNKKEYTNQYKAFVSKL